MEKLVYVGNKRLESTDNPTTIDTLSKKLSPFFELISVSSKKNIFVRYLDIVFTVMFNNKNSIILVDTYSGLAWWYAASVAFISKTLKAKYILILHGGNLPIRAHSNVKIARFMFDNAHRLVAPSDYLKRSLAFCTHNDIKVIPNFIDLESAKYSYWPPQGPEISLIWVRAFHNIYNPKLALDIMSGLRAAGIKARLTMIGPDKDGSLDILRERRNELDLSKCVTLIPGLPKSEWFKLAETATFFINTTNVDNTPVSVVEAMSLGKVIISTDVGGLPDLIEDGVNGFLVPRGDSRQFVKKIIELIADPDLCEMVSFNARNRALDFDWTNIERLWLKLLK